MRPCLVGAVTILVGFPGVSAAAEAPTTPQALLATVEQAYGSGDVALLGSLLTEDYEFLTQQGLEWPAAKELELLGQLFQVSTCALSFSKDVDLKCITVDPRTWAIPHLETTLVVVDANGTHEVKNRVTLYLIEDANSGAVRIFRWVEEPTALESCN